MYQHLLLASDGRSRTYLKIEIKVIDIRDTLVNDRAGTRVAIPHGLLLITSGEAGVMSLAADYNRETWSIRFAARFRVELFESLKDAC